MQSREEKEILSVNLLDCTTTITVYCCVMLGHGYYFSN